MLRTQNAILETRIGKYSRDSVLVTETGRDYCVPDQFNPRVEQAWNDVLAKADSLIAQGKRKGRPFSGPLYRLDSHANHDDMMHLALSKTDFKASIGTNWEAGLHPAYMAELKSYGQEVSDERAAFADALAGCAVIETMKDGKPVVIVGVRSHEQDEYPLSLHVPGTVGNRKAFEEKSLRFDPFQAIVSDVLERELCLTSDDIQDIYITGLIRNSHTEKPELTYGIELNPQIDFDTIRTRRFEKAQMRAEHFKIMGLGKEEVVNLLNGTQNPNDSSSIDHLPLSEKEKEAIKNHLSEREKLVVNTNNWWVPPGEIALVLYLANKGVNIRQELPYLRF